ncbi:MAG TPA: MacB family efflux pump subunit [Elusimicrobia bacterium]|nr:MAG: MacB family efflux pump subunit [Elusimicrobia bacterium RIFOXYA12_FULL_49_49]OGS06272.1 MAG: MacB family efflux pump subunit [Elusimicrobia bacterium RIFOXYA1_FULL_47_7]OGS11909.1 MAG: MacB family efflux pump subunit [Elusimicrobia bacterium RIFOXYB1_FULL_48_9]OGS14920.1 MAG: MacB family efflux pump subunit [Elusimicrobia bacterium RIFOXYA2_FULL_47_53]OGS26145.1 MAG: MacB family efflux pump subunit [Elusimicrobia bacterium RIFOXYB12_FULL_50_12]OGS29265.1 MAG: MacB family efflux pump s
MNVIELKNITKTYHLGKIDVPVLHGVSLSIAEGEFVAIMGHSGSGKSTLLNILGLLDKPSGGEYSLAGKEVSKLTDDELASLRNKFMGFVFQQFNLLPRMTAKENVALPMIYSVGKEKYLNETALLEKVGLGGRVMHKPNELSGGQQQRVAIARALINNPLLILADEPTGNLDSKSSEEIISILKSLNEAGITIVMVTHEPDLTAAASRIIRVQDGLIVSDEIREKRKSAHDRIKGANGSMHHNVANASRVRDYFMQALRSLVSNKTRSVLSILGVLIGVASLIAMLALGRGAQEQVKKNISSLGSNLLMVRASSPFRGGVSLETGSATRFTIQDSKEVMERVPGVDKVVAYVSGRGQVTFSGRNWNTQVQGTTADYPAVRNSVPQKGRFFTREETITRARVAVLGKTVVDNLFADQDPIGQYIKIKRVDFQVIGVLPEKGARGFQNDDDKIIIPLNTAMYRLLGKEYIDSMDVQVSQSDKMDDVSDAIKKLITRTHRLPASRTDLIDIRNMADIQETISSTMKAFSYLLGSIAFISLLVGGIGIMNIMLVSVSERTREIGLRKAIGANDKDILFQFVIESVVVCAIGGIMGIAVGSLISVGFAKFAGWSTVIAFYSVAMAFTFSVLIGLVFGIWPARKASQLNPIDALRYE